MDTAQQPYVRDDAAVRTWQLVRRFLAVELSGPPRGAGSPEARPQVAPMPDRRLTTCAD
ncbi:hypothetical protein [Streptomyces phaeochromogenes]|uniref:hypothetical protein n=1 Tax=Streptomyces phaeochromogenes TaxID=1923 RepID=UPI002DD8B736|nr:hypothetical protein [Streptomyces phaeochromogenes]WRZ32476.1 hypothetical protein OG931_34480 [Streptomyces phaeochromogenes]